MSHIYRAACGRDKPTTDEQLKETHPRATAPPDLLRVLMAWNGNPDAADEWLRTSKTHFEDCLTCPHLTDEIEHAWASDESGAAVVGVRLRFCNTFQLLKEARP